jgi:hypothetical protein
MNHYFILQHPLALCLLFINVFTAVLCATHTKSFQIQNLKFKTLICFSFYVLFNTAIAQHVSVYLAITRCTEIAGGIAALLYTVVTCFDGFSYVYNLILKSKVCILSFRCSMCYDHNIYTWHNQGRHTHHHKKYASL